MIRKILNKLRKQFLHPSFKSIIKKFAIVEITATEEKYEKFKKIIEESKTQSHI